MMMMMTKIIIIIIMMTMMMLMMMLLIMMMMRVPVSQLVTSSNLKVVHTPKSGSAAAPFLLADAPWFFAQIRDAL